MIKSEKISLVIIACEDFVTDLADKPILLAMTF